MEERKLLVDASRESSRTFDQTMLTFGSAIFGFSIAFLKDVAPHPLPDTLGWLAASWLMFSIGLLAIALSFLFSQKACDFQIGESENLLRDRAYKSPKNTWSIATSFCNVACVVLLFLGILCWSRFALHNLGHGETPLSDEQRPKEKTGYVPPSAPPRVPTQPTSPPPPQPPTKK